MLGVFGYRIYRVYERPPNGYHRAYLVDAGGAGKAGGDLLGANGGYATGNGGTFDVPSPDFKRVELVRYRFGPGLLSVGFFWGIQGFSAFSKFNNR